MPNYESIVDEVQSMYQEVVSESQPDAEVETEPVKEDVAEADEVSPKPDKTTTEPEEPEVEEVAEAEADESDDEEDPVEALRKLTEDEKPEEEPIELSSEQELLLQEFKSKFTNPDNLLRHAVRQAQTAENGIKTWKEKAQKALSLAREQYPEFEAESWKPNIEMKLRSDIASKKGWSADELNEWVADNEDVFNRAVEAEVLRQKSDWDKYRSEKLAEIDAESEKIGNDLNKRNAERAAAIRKRFDKYAEKVGEDPILQGALYDALAFDGEGAPASDDQRFLDAQAYRDRSMAKTLANGRNIGQNVEDAALKLVLKSDRLRKMLGDALRPKQKAEPVKKVKVASKSAGAEEKAAKPNPSSDNRRPQTYNDRMASLTDELMASLKD